jgi:hypothetical protein
MGAKFEELGAEEQQAVAWAAQNIVEGMQRRGDMPSNGDVAGALEQACESLACSSSDNIRGLVADHRTALSGQFKIGSRRDHAPSKS